MDKTYKKQLEKFGIESTQIVEGRLDQKRQDESIQILNDVVKSLMKSMEGRQWIYSKLDMCRVFTSPFIPQDPHGTSFFAGVQSVGQNLLDDIMRSSPEDFFLMVQEANARKINQQDPIQSS